MKIDLRKAYDSVSWEFLGELLEKFKFPEKFRLWIMTCITSPSFSISVNGGLCDFFKRKKGLRQGDPTSPLLFVLIVEYFTRILKKMSNIDDFCFHHRCKSLKLYYLVFANDLMLFYKGGVKSVHLMIRALKAFSNAFGLSANNEKSVIYFGNVHEEIKLRILQVTRFQMGSFSFRYLGVLITSRRLSVVDCVVLVDKILRRILCWTSRNLSYVGRNVFVNSVLLSIHTYWAQVFLIPKIVLHKITQICRSFL